MVPGANLGDELGGELAATDSRGAGRIEQHVGDAGCGRDDCGPWTRLGLDDGSDLVTRAASPTEVPPNFITIIWPVPLLCYRDIKSGGSVSAPACRSVLLECATLSRVPPDRQAR